MEEDREIPPAANLLGEQQKKTLSKPRACGAHGKDC
jgi:hypothetical protein